ncbi:hypothetical protein ACN3E9_02385 [Vibrio pectenicida]|uniref:hypothetical protein n=1 Tax=Vibrio pectenicida TaxID=62763 RepID=UPI003B9A9263
MKNLTLDSLSEVSGGNMLFETLNSFNISNENDTLSIQGYGFKYSNHHGVHRIETGSFAVEYNAGYANT